jgi:uncharacterized membrane protein YvlD (DUF360 family)
MTQGVLILHILSDPLWAILTVGIFTFVISGRSI